VHQGRQGRPTAATAKLATEAPHAGASRAQQWDTVPAMTVQREQPWSDEAVRAGRILVLSDNPISRAVQGIATTAGRQVLLREADDDGQSIGWLTGCEPTATDAVLLCDHDAPDAPGLLRAALAGPAGYIAMMASRSRSNRLLADLRDEGYEDALARLHVPAGLNIGGKAPGEIALSVVAEIVAWGYDRPGGPLRNHT
jgi:xanthine dehydrogenase accessory factor